jgi:hypothetical protein
MRLGAPGVYLNSQAIESFLNFNADKGSEGTLFGAGNYAGSNWHEYDVATGQQRNMGRVPGNSATTYIIYVGESFGADYGSYFAFVPEDGTLRRWSGSGWDVIASGAPANNDYLYGRAGFESVHQVFYWITNSYSGNDSWTTYIARPYPFSGTSASPPTVSLAAAPAIVAMQGTSTLSWQSNDAESCTASGGWNGVLPTSGEQVVGPLVTDQTYSIACSGSGGTATDAVTVIVQMAEPMPTLNLTVNPQSVNEGGFATIGWTSANADSCSALRDWSGAKPVQGSETIGPLFAESEYELQCVGAGGSTSELVTVTIVASANPTPPPVPPPEPEPQSSGGGTTPPIVVIALLAILVRRYFR